VGLLYIYRQRHVINHKVFEKKHNINIAFKTSDTLGKNLTKAWQKSSDTDKYGMSGIYKLRCGTCAGVYVGQTGRRFRIRHKEHLNDIKYNSDKAGYSQHILNTQHEFSRHYSSRSFRSTP
jgi:hypothetical protein